MSRHRHAVAPTALLAALVFGGCARPLEEEVASAVVTSALQTSRNGGVSQFVTDLEARDEEGCINDPAAAAADAAARPPVGLYPSSCVQKAAEAEHLHAEFDGCTGAFGRVTLQGGVDAVFSSTGSCRMHADVVDSGDLTANERPLDYDAQADILYRDGYRDVDWAGHWKGTTRRGLEAEQRSSLSVLVDAETTCLDIVGTTAGHVGEWDFGTTLTDLAICPDACPSRGVVEATLEGALRDRTLTVEFDGSDVAYVKGWTGREFEVEMVCGDE